MSSPLAVGSIVADTYRVTSQLGVGGMGAVFAAEHLRLPGKHVAVKVLHAAMATPEIFARFRREAEIASRIGHPNIVEVLDFNNLPTGEPFLVMELLTGESLGARLKRGRLTEKHALDVARQIGSALDAAHRMDVVHRDLKPDNIFLCPRDVDGELRDHVKVLDFGISKIRNAQTVLTQDMALLGTPYYMSPEQASGKNQEIDGRTDIFALGAIVFEMLTGVTAFPGNSIPAVIFQVVYQQHPSIKQLAPATSPRVVAAVDRALAKNAADRFPTMAELVEALTGRPLMNTARLSQAPALASTMAAPDALAGTAVAPAAQAALAGTAVAPAAPSIALTGTPVASTQAAAVTAVTKSGKTGWIVAGVVVLAAATAGAFVWRGRTPETPKLAGPATKTEAKIEEPVTPPEKPPVVAVDASPATTAVAVTKAGPPPKHEDKAPGKTPHPKVAKDEPLTATLLADLDGAERALAAKDAREAIRLARHSLYERKTARASSILTRAFCLQQDLGAAKAEMAHVAASERGKVVRACRAAGVDLAASPW
jgi:eukaryotic-like serine/threonine-protein kinase